MNTIAAQCIPDAAVFQAGGRTCSSGRTFSTRCRGSEIVVMGNDAQKFAEVFPRGDAAADAQRRAQPGRAATSLAVLRSIIAKLVGTAAAGGAEGVLQRAGAGAEGEKDRHRLPRGLDPAGSEGAGLRGARLSRKGWRWSSASWANANYSGIGISCGSGLCNVCLAVLSVPVISFSVPRRAISSTAQAALVTGELATRMRVQKEQAFQLNGLDGRPGAKRADGVLRGDDREPGGDAAQPHRLHAAAAQAGAIHPAGAERRHGDAEGVPGAFPAGAAGHGFPDAALGRPGVRRCVEFHGAGRLDGSALLGIEASAKAAAANRKPCQPAPVMTKSSIRDAAAPAKVLAKGVIHRDLAPANIMPTGPAGGTPPDQTAGFRDRAAGAGETKNPAGVFAPAGPRRSNLTLY